MTTDIVSPAKRRQMMQAVRRHGTNTHDFAASPLHRVVVACNDCPQTALRASTDEAPAALIASKHQYFFGDLCSGG